MDTSKAAGAIQATVQGRLSAPERLLIALQMSLMARELLLAGLRRRHPTLKEPDLQVVLMRTILGTGVLPSSDD